MTPDPGRGLGAAAALTGAAVLLGGFLLAWRPPPGNGGALLLLPLWGLALGVFGRTLRPGWRARAVGIGGLLAAGIAINLLWLPAMQHAARDAPLGLRSHRDLLSRTLNSWHPLISTRALPLALGRLVAGREVRRAPSASISARRLVVLADASRVVEIEDPGPWVPEIDEWTARYEILELELRTRRPGGFDEHRVVGVTDGAEQAEWFVVIGRDGVTLAVPSMVWQAEERRARGTEADSSMDADRGAEH